MDITQKIKSHNTHIHENIRAQFGPGKRFLSVFFTLVDCICLKLQIMIAGYGS